jgi:hypothetical protein
MTEAAAPSETLASPNVLLDYTVSHPRRQQTSKDIQFNICRQRITEAITTVTPESLIRVCTELEYRVDVRSAVNGTNIKLSYRIY